MKKLLSIFLTLTMLISVASVLSAPTTASAASKTGKKYVSYKVKRKIIKREGRVILDGKIKYPKLKAKTKAAKKINKYLKSEAEKTADSIIELAKDDYDNNGLSTFNNMNAIYTYDINIKLTYNAKGKYSFRFSQYEYTMGVHGYELVTGHNFSKKTGKKISNSKLTKYSNKTLRKKIVAKVKAKINKEPNRYFDGALDSVKKLKFSRFVFYLGGKYLYVRFNQYEISPYVAGPTTVKIKL